MRPLKTVHIKKNLKKKKKDWHVAEQTVSDLEARLDSLRLPGPLLPGHLTWESGHQCEGAQATQETRCCVFQPVAPLAPADSHHQLSTT